MQRPLSPTPKALPDFIEFLHANQKTIQKNLAELSEENLGSSVITRIFNSVSSLPDSFKEVPNYFINAWKNDEIDFWYSLFISTISHDLLDAEGDLKDEVKNILKGFLPHRKEDPSGEKGWKLLCRDLSPIEVAKLIMISYIIELVVGAISGKLAESICHKTGTLTCFSPNEKERLIKRFKTAIDYYKKKKTNYNFSDAPDNGIDEIIDAYERKPDDSTFAMIFNKCINYELRYQLDSFLPIHSNEAFKIAREFITSSLQSAASSKEMATKELQKAIQSHLRKINPPLKKQPVSVVDSLTDEDAVPAERMAKLTSAQEAAQERAQNLEMRLRLVQQENQRLQKQYKESQVQINDLTKQLEQKDKQREEVVNSLTGQLEVKAKQFEQTERWAVTEAAKSQVAEAETQAARNAAQAALELAEQTKERAALAISQANLDRAAMETRVLNAEAANRVVNAQLGEANVNIAALTTEANQFREQANTRVTSLEADVARLNTVIEHLNADINSRERADQQRQARDAEIARKREEEQIARDNAPDVKLRKLILDSQNAEIDPQNIEDTYRTLVEYQDHLRLQIPVSICTDQLAHDPVRTMAKKVGENPGLYTLLDQSHRKALIKYDSCEKLKNTLIGDASPLEKSVRFGIELVKGDHLNKLEASRTGKLGWAVKILLAPFTFFSSLFTYQSRAGKKAVASIHTLFTPTIKGMTSSIAHKRRNEEARNPNRERQMPAARSR